jgi:1-deoxy-D-xylulose-5-phosphate synthase
MIRDGEALAILTLGHPGNHAESACKALEGEGLRPAHYDLRFLKPLDETLLHGITTKFPTLVTVEDGSVNGGFGSAVLEFLADHGYRPKVVRLGIPDRFVEQGTVEELQKECGFDTEGIIRVIRGLLA